MNISSHSMNKYDIITTEDLNIIDIIINCTVINIVAIFGVVGNVLNVVILSYQGLGDSTNVILFSLSLVDLLYVAALPVRRISCLVSRFDPFLAMEVDAYVNMCLAVPLRLISLISSAHIVMISAERNVAVYLPLLVTRIFTVRNTVLYLLFLYIFWLVLSVPLFNMFAVTSTLDPTTNTTLTTLTFSDFFLFNTDALVFYNLFVVTNIRGPISLIFIFLSSIATGAKLHQATKKRLKLTSSAQKPKFDIKAVKMLLMVCLVYLGISVPGFIPILMYYVDQTFYLFEGRTTLIYVASEYMIDFLLIVNSSVNFLIYVTMSRKFSRTYSFLIEKWLSSRLSTVKN
ncbi:FMRFamide receptor [Biomphalaria pfeifferi]|uniref:FMRFamide receptor n=1 Tax=Biomphalaria pfeifferi TaxID=112525 RepID=A0AAD8BGX3_BIOPF|nr:FMRFamide receptor [Biomphalaria pfeifferi]